MSGNLNQSVRRTITNTPPIVSLMKSSPKARIPANKKKKYYPGVFFKTASKIRRFVHHYAFVCIIFVF